MIHPFIALYGNSEADKASNKHLLIIVVIQQLLASLVAQTVKNLPAMWEMPFDSWVGEIVWRRDRLRTPVFMGFPGGSDNKESACNVRDLGSITGLGKSPRGGWGNPLQYSCLENPHGQRSLVGYSARGHKHLDTTEWLSTYNNFTNSTRDIARSESSDLSNLLLGMYYKKKTWGWPLDLAKIMFNTTFVITRKLSKQPEF